MQLYFCVKNLDLSRLQGDDVGPGFLKGREPPQVWMEHMHLAEDTGLFVGDPGWVEVCSVLWRKQVPTLPTQGKHGSYCRYKFRLKEQAKIFKN